MATDDEVPFIDMLFMEAYPLRNLITFVKQKCVEMALLFSPKGISFSHKDAENKVMIHFRIKASELGSYTYTACDDNGDAIPTISAGLMTNEAFRVFSTSSRRSKCRLYMLPDDCNFYINIISPGETMGEKRSIDVIPTVIVEPFSPPEVNYSRGLDDPNVKIEAPDFTKMCSSFTKMKCQSVIITGYPAGIAFKGILAGGNIGGLREFGICKMEETKTERSSS